MTTMQGPARDYRIDELRSIAKSVESAFPTAATLLRAIAVTLSHSPGETCAEADERAADNWHRAESAEAEVDDLRARLAKVEALADDWGREGRDYPAGVGEDLRAALANPESESARGVHTV